MNIAFTVIFVGLMFPTTSSAKEKVPLHVNVQAEFKAKDNSVNFKVMAMESKPTKSMFFINQVFIEKIHSLRHRMIFPQAMRCIGPRRELCDATLRLPLESQEKIDRLSGQVVIVEVLPKEKTKTLTDLKQAKNLTFKIGNMKYVLIDAAQEQEEITINIQESKERLERLLSLQNLNDDGPVRLVTSTKIIGRGVRSVNGDISMTFKTETPANDAKIELMDYDFKIWYVPFSITPKWN